MLTTVVQAWTTAATQMRNLCEFEDVPEDLVQRLRIDCAMTIRAGEERVRWLAFRDARCEHHTAGTKAVRQIRADGHET